MRAKYKVLIRSKRHNWVLIKDLCNELNSMSITNDAEAVVDDMYKNHNLGDSDLYYVDTDERIDKLIHKKEDFIGFGFGFENLDKFEKHFKIEDYDE
jgi:hypothetical protein